MRYLPLLLLAVLVRGTEIAPFPLPGHHGETTVDLDVTVAALPAATVRLAEIGSPDRLVAWLELAPDGSLAVRRRFVTTEGEEIIRAEQWFAPGLTAGQTHHFTLGMAHTWKGYVYWAWLDGHFAAEWMNALDPARDSSLRSQGVTVANVDLRKGTHPPARASQVLNTQSTLALGSTLLYCAFDGSVAPTTGSAALLDSPAEPQFVPGVVGQALRLGTGDRWRNTGDLLRYDLSALPAERGTIACWVRFDDWQPADVGSPLITGPYPLQLWVYQTRRTMPLVYARYGERRLPVEVGRFNPPFPGEPNRWMHLTITWTAPRIAVYVDGRLFNEGEMRCEGQVLDAVGGGWGDDTRLEFCFPEATCLDELVVYPVGLSPREAAGYRHGFWNAVSHFGQVAYAPGLEQVRVVAMDLAKVWLHAPAEVTVTVTDAAERRVAGPVRFTLASDRGESPTIHLPRPLPPGQYDVHVQATDGKRQAANRIPIHRREFEWLDHPVAAEPGLLPPWTPVRASGRQLAAWGRTWDCDGFWLPAQIATTQDEPTLGPSVDTLLAAPMRLELEMDGETVVVSGDGNVSGRADQAVDVAATFTNGGLKIRHTGTLEFDGSFRHRLTLEKRWLRGAEAVDALRLVIPLRPEVARFFHVVTDHLRELKRSGALPANEGLVWGSGRDYWGAGGAPVRPQWGKPASDHWTDPPTRGTPRFGTFVPYLWVGNEDRGLAWWANTDRGWAIDPAADAIALRRHGDRVDLVVTFIQRPTTIDTPREIAWAVTPTPARPRPPQWRKWVADTTLYGASSRWARTCSDVYPSQWYLDKKLATDPLRGQAAAKTTSIVHYADIRAIGGATPEGEYFATTWRPGVAVNPPAAPDPMVAWIDPQQFREYTSHDPRAYGSSFGVPVPSNRDWRAYCTEVLITQCGWNGTYLDDTYLYAWDWPEHGLGYTLPDGSRQTEYTLELWRAATQRYAAVFAAHGIVWPRLIAHCTNTVMVSALGFCPVSYVAEWGDHEGCRDLLEKYNPDVMRASCIGRNLGFVPSWHGTVGTACTDKEAENRRETAILLLHDVWRFRPWQNEPEQLRHQWARDGREIAFHPYWAAAPAVRTDSPSVLASAYHGDSETILTVVNYLDDAHEATVTVPPAWLAGKTAPAGATFSGDTVRLTCPPRDAVVLIVR